MGHHHWLFNVFLIVYGGFLLAHVWGMGFTSWHMLVVMLMGVAVAFIAHKQHGYVPSVLLVSHMIVEWCYHALHGNHYSLEEIVFHGVHALLDVVFLCIEAKEHYAKYALRLLAMVTLVLLGVFVYYYVPPRQVASVPVSATMSPLIAQALEVRKAMSGNHVHGGGIIHYTVIGGMIGCVMAHLISWMVLVYRQKDSARP